MRNKGFTFIELLIVAAIIGILASMGTPLLKNTASGMARRAGAKRIASFCRFLSVTAAAENSVIILTVDGETGMIRATREGEESVVNAFNIGESVTVACDKQQVVFYPDGHRGSFTITITARGRTTSVTPGGYGRFIITEI